jgi:hypothetical protein
MVALLGVALTPILLLGAPARSDAQESADSVPKPGTVADLVRKNAPKPDDEEVWRLLLRAVAAAKPELTQAAAQQLLAMDRQRVLAAMGRYVQRPDRARAVMGFVGTYFMDKQAVPIVTQALRQADGPALRHAVLIARLMPDPAFVGPLIENALSSDYRTTAVAGAPHGSEQISISVFAEATLTLHALTKGKSGIKPVSAREETKEKKEALIAQWRAWWKANKDTWQAEPPGNQKPKENPSPAKNAPEKGASEETQPPPKADPPKEPPPPAAGQEAKSP